MDHKPVMVNEVMLGLNIKKDGYYIDATFGRGGHSRQILVALGGQGKLIAIDRDKEAVDYAHQYYKDDRLEVIHSNFSKLRNILSARNLIGKIDGILLDLGISSAQLDNALRGFSFKASGPLDMRMDTAQEKTLASWLESASVEEIAAVLYQFGEERKSYKIARAIKSAQQAHTILTTKQLADIIMRTVHASRKSRQKIHPATRSFQAFRIFINQELGALKSLLTDTIDCLAHHGRLVVISFHSLEDRIVKQFISKYSCENQVLRGLMTLAQENTGLAKNNIPLKKIARHFASKEELAHNRRARSAVLRVAEKQ